MKITLAGHTWHAYSPSMFELESHPIQLVYNGEAWYLAYAGNVDGACPWPSRTTAATAIADAFVAHQMQEHGLC
jgi:hypothetical protein